MSPDGSLEQFSWGALKRDGLSAWTFKDGSWVRLRSNRDLLDLGSRVAIAPIGASPDEIEALSSVSPPSFTAKDAARVLRFKELLQAGPVASLSNGFAPHASKPDGRLLDYLWGRTDSIHEISSRYGEHIAQYVLEHKDNLSDADIAYLLHAMSQPTSDEIWDSAAKDMFDKLVANFPEHALLAERIESHHSVFYELKFETPGRSGDPESAAALCDLALSIASAHADPPRTIKDSIRLARDLIVQHGSPHAAMRHLTGLKEDCSLQEAVDVYNLLAYGALDPQVALAVARLADGDPNLLDLFASEMHNTATIDVARASAIKEDYIKDPLSAMFLHGSAARAVSAFFQDAKASLSHPDAASLALALGYPSLDRAHPDLRTSLDRLHMDSFLKTLEFAKIENNSGVPHAELALRLSLAFGPHAEDYLRRMTAPSKERILIQRASQIAPHIASQVLLARSGKEYIQGASDAQDRRLRRQAVGNVQAYSKEKLQDRLESLSGSIPAIKDAQEATRQKISALRAVEGQDNRQEINRLYEELNKFPETLASKEREMRALSALLDAYDSASDEQIGKLTEDWVLATPQSPPKNAGLSLHDAAFWLPTDPDVAASLGAWLLEGDRAEKIFDRPTGISDMMLISSAWSDMAPLVDPDFAPHSPSQPSPLSASLSHSSSRSFGHVLEHARQVTAAGDFGDRFSSALSRIGATASSSQTSLDLVRESWDTPTPFPLEKTWSSSDPSVPTLRGRFIPRDDIRGTQLGILTNCCQHPTGAGRTCAESGQTHPAMGFFVVEDAAGNVISQSWVWSDGSGGVCFDNVEGKPRQEQHNAVVDVYEQASRDLLGRYERVTVGAHNSISFANATNTQSLSLSSVGYHGYSDATRGQLLLASRSSSDSGSLTTLGLPDGFIWRQGESSVTVRKSGLVFDGPDAHDIAQRMLPSMAARTWEVSGSSGSFTLEITDNPHLTPSIEGLPLTLFDPTDTELEMISSFSPGMDKDTASLWFRATSRDMGLVETALSNGWDPESAALAMRSDTYGRRVLSNPMPAPEVVRGIAAGLSPERASIPSIQGVLADASALAPEATPAKLASVIPWAARSSNPAAAAAALSHCTSEAHYPTVLSLVESGADPRDVRNLARQQEHNMNMDGPFDARYAPRFAALTPEELSRAASYVAIRSDRPMSSEFYHPEVILAIATQPQDVVHQILNCDQTYRTDPRTVDFVLAGGDPSDWRRVSKAVGITDPGTNQRASGSFLASVSKERVDALDAALDAARVQHAVGENQPPHYYSPKMLEVLSDSSAVSAATECVARMLPVSGDDYYCLPENSTDFAGLVEARVSPSDAETLARSGVTARMLASACGDYRVSNRPSGQQVAALASVSSHPLATSEVLNRALHSASLIPFVTDVLSSQEVSPQAAALLERVVYSQDSSDAVVFAQAWSDPSNRPALLSRASSRDSLGSIVASSIKSLPGSLGGLRGTFKSSSSRDDQDE